MDVRPTERALAVPAVVWAIPAIALILALAPMPYGFYELLRLVVCGAACWMAWLLLREDRQPWLGWVFVGLALLYNPLLRVHLDRSIWMVLNALSAAPFVWVGWLQRHR